MCIDRYIFPQALMLPAAGTSRHYRGYAWPVGGALREGECRSQSKPANAGGGRGRSGSASVVIAADHVPHVKLRKCGNYGPVTDSQVLSFGYEDDVKSLVGYLPQVLPL